MASVLLTTFLLYTATRAITDIEIYCKFSLDNIVEKWEMVLTKDVKILYYPYGGES